MLTLRNNVIQPVMADLASVHRHHAFVSFSLPFEKDSFRAIRGAPVLTLWIKVHTDKKKHDKPGGSVDAQLIAYLYDLEDRARARLITCGPVTLYQPQAMDQWVKVSIPLRLAAYNIPAGHRLALGIGTKDRLYRSAGSDWGGIHVEILSRTRKGSLSSLVVPLEKKGME